MGNRAGKLDELFDWFTIPYRTLRFWGLLLFLILIAVGGFYGFLYITERQERVIQSTATRESRPARFIEVEGDVRVKQVNQTNWISARRVKDLNAGDVIETSAGSTCKVSYFDGTTAHIGVNTLYIVAESFINPQNDTQHIKGEITTGEVRMNTPAERKKGSISLATQEAEARLDPNTEATGRRNKETGASQFFVWQGRAEVADSDKKVTVLGANQQLGVSKSGGTSVVRSLPPPPEIVSPQDMEPLFVTALPAQVDLRWKPVAGISQYRLRVSGDPSFTKQRVNQVLKGTNLRVSLGAGSYFWQVYSVDKDGVESANPQTSKFFVSSSTIRRYGKPIRLDVTTVIAMGDMWEVMGRTDPGVRLTLNGKNVDILGDGRFKAFTDPIGNATSLELVARDISGNITSRTVPIK
ncbi:MAG TPA: hypothetical protein VGK99_18400 [Acidobacteriota bacterium]|jgi:hypothetical protein